MFRLKKDSPLKVFILHQNPTKTNSIYVICTSIIHKLICCLDEHMLILFQLQRDRYFVLLWPIDSVCGDVLNMAMCLNVCSIVLQVEEVKDQFCITSCNFSFGKCKSDFSIAYMCQGNSLPVSCFPYEAFCC